MDKNRNIIEPLLGEVHKVIVGYDKVLELLAYSLLVTRGHALIKSLPGLSKSLIVRCFQAAISNCSTARIQMTPDMLPSSIIGGQILNLKTNEFEVRKGPIFNNILLTDELNRTTPKVQSALLEAMAEGQVTIEGITYPLPPLFITMATVNPIEQEGTYPLPEAQLDRFMFEINMGYLSHADELKMAANDELTSDNPVKAINQIISVEEILALREEIRQTVYVSQAALDYIVDIVRATRQEDHALKDAISKIKPDGMTFENSIAFGASPRAIQALKAAGRVRAYHQGHNFVTPQDVQYVAHSVLRHRIILDRRARMNKQFNTNKAVDVVLKAVPFHPDENAFKPPCAK